MHTRTRSLLRTAPASLIVLHALAHAVFTGTPDYKITAVRVDRLQA